MAASKAYERIVSAEEFLRIQESSRDKIELWEGRIVSTAGGSVNHGLIIGNLGGVCRDALRGRKCRFLGENFSMVIDEPGTYYHADGAIACPPNHLSQTAGTFDNPTVVFEVLSSSTENADRTTKFEGYASLPSVQEIVLIESRRMRVEVHERREEGWLRRTNLPNAAVRLTSVGVELSMEELYEDTTFGDEA